MNIFYNIRCLDSWMKIQYIIGNDLLWLSWYEVFINRRKSKGQPFWLPTPIILSSSLPQPVGKKIWIVIRGASSQWYMISLGNITILHVVFNFVGFCITIFSGWRTLFKKYKIFYFLFFRCVCHVAPRFSYTKAIESSTLVNNMMVRRDVNLKSERHSTIEVGLSYIY